MNQLKVNSFLTVLLACVLFSVSTSSYAATTIDGVRAGAPYRIVIPDDWNGDLVVLLHGYVFPELPLTLPPQGHEIFLPLTAGLNERGFAVAYSAYRVNGYAVREGLRDTRYLISLAEKLLGRPMDTYLLSYSMGTHIGQSMLERGPKKFSGMLGVCAAVGGASLQNHYFHDARVLFDYFYREALQGNVLTSDMDYFTEVLPAVIGAIQLNPFPAIELASVINLAWTSPQELVEGIVSALVLAGGGTNELQAVARGVSYDNQEQVYGGSLNDDSLNALVGRFQGDPQALRYMQQYYDPTGKLPDVPIFHLHTSRDPIVPLNLHVPAFQDLLDQHESNDQYQLRVFDRFGHCQMLPEEVLAGFDELVDWARLGIKPES